MSGKRGVDDDLGASGRFAAFTYDPRFKRVRKEEKAVKVDSRFAKLATDKKYNDLGISGQTAGVIVKGAAAESPAAAASASSSSSAAPAAAGAKFQSLEERLELLNMMARGEIEGDSSSSDEEDGSDADAAALARELDADVLAAEAADTAPDIGEGASAPTTEDATRRLAAVNLDWDNTRAEDLFAVLSSFVPAGGRLERVSVFPSDYGEKMIAQERRLGPQGVWAEEEEEDEGAAARRSRLAEIDAAADRRAAKKRERRKRGRAAAAGGAEGDGESDSGGESGSGGDSEPSGASSDEGEDVDDGAAADESDGSEGEEEDDDPGSDGDDASDSSESESESESEGRDGGETFDPEKLRRYELARLRYFFAEAVFDSATTANKVYEECDGREFGSTGTFLDLRFVPDDTTFGHKVARDESRGVDGGRYEAPQFSTSALRSTNVELSWDAPDPRRERKLREWISAMKRAGTGKKGKGRAHGETEEEAMARREEEMRQFLAPASGEEDFDADSDGSDGSDSGDSGRGEDEDGEADAGGAQPSAAKGGAASGSKADAGGKAAAKAERRRRKAEARRKAQLLLSAALGSDDEGGPAAPLGASRADGEVMESTFTPGLGQELEERRQRKEAEKGETAWQAYLRKRKEKRGERKRARKEAKLAVRSSEAAAAGAATDLYDDGPGAEAEEDPFFSEENLRLGGPAGFSAEGAEEERAAAAPGLRVSGGEELERKRRQRRQERAEKAAREAEEQEWQRREQANLELMMMADPGTAEGAAETDARGFDSRELARARKDAAGKGGSKARKRRREEAAGALQRDGFDVDVADDRFARVGADPEMAIDPTNPAFKDTPAIRKLMRERQRKRDEAEEAGDDREAERAAKRAATGGAKVSGGAALAALVANVKRKAVGAAAARPTVPDAEARSRAGKASRKGARRASRK